LVKNANSLQVILLKTIKKGEEWLTNYGKDFWLKGSNYYHLDAKTQKKCRDFYKISVADIIDDETSEPEENGDGEHDDNDNESGGSGSESRSEDSAQSSEDEA